MNLNWFEGLIYGLVSGLSEFLPISSRAHQALLLEIFGSSGIDPVMNMFTHIAILLSLFSGCSAMIGQLRREQRLHQRSRRGHVQNSRMFYDLRLVKNATLPLLLGFILLSYIFPSESGLLTVAIFLLINGIILYIPDRMLQGNKDARSMSVLDSILIGISGALSALIGISRVGIITSVAVSRGSLRQNALNWAFLLSIPALVLTIGLDIVQIFAFAGEISFWSSIPAYLLSTVGAYCGGYCSILLIKSLTARNAHSGFAYYSWGAALLAFVLYLTVV